MDEIAEFIESVPEPSKILQYSFSALVLLICGTGIIANTVIVMAIFRTRRNGSISGFYTIAMMLAICDYAKLIGYLILLYPYIRSIDLYFPEPSKSALLLIEYILYDISFFGSFLFLPLTAFNRLCHIMVPSFSKFVFENKIVLGLIISICWAIAGFLSFAGIYSGNFSFASKLFFFPESDRIAKVGFFWELVKYLRLIFVQHLPTYIVVVYPIILIRLYFIKRNLKKSGSLLNIKLERMLAAEGFIIWAQLFSFGWYFDILNNNLQTSFEVGSHYAFLLDTIINIVGNVCHPFIYLICDYRLRDEVKLLLKINFGVITIKSLQLVPSSNAIT